MIIKIKGDYLPRDKYLDSKLSIACTMVIKHFLYIYINIRYPNRTNNYGQHKSPFSIEIELEIGIYRRSLR